MNTRKTIYGYCPILKKKHSVVLTCIDTGMGSYLKGQIDCEYNRNGENCEDCQICNSIPKQFLPT